jgi:DNA-binding NtrC family response regulator
MIKLLITDDDKNLTKVLKNELSGEGFEVAVTESGEKAIEMLEKEEYDVMLLDLHMPSFDGMDVLKSIKAAEIPVEVIILTGNATVSSAVKAMKLGAYDYLTKPFKIEELKAVVAKAYEKKELLSENLHLKMQIKRQSEIQQIVTKHPLMFQILEMVKKVATSDLPALILGESGVGKELVAKAIHEASGKGEGPFIPVNCGAIPENMMETELFGHEKGAFTGAHARKLGLLEIAHHGTLFLDEISELNSSLQGKLLRAIETKKFFRVGGVKEIAVDVRFISATNRDIRNEVEKGSFRADLYYRISTLSIHIPPLRERREDIPLLIDHTIRSNLAFRKKAFSKGALSILSAYSWPGNVRELQNVVHRTILLSKNDMIEPSDLPSDLGPGVRKAGKRLDEVERDHILNVLKEAEGQRAKAAEILGIDPKTLYRKLQSYGVKE